MSVTNPEQAKNFFSHFPVPDSLTWDEVYAVDSLPEGARDYFLSDRHATVEVFGRSAMNRPVETLTQYAARQSIEAA